MAKRITSNLPALVDAFVQTVNSRPRERECLDDVPLFLRGNDSQSEMLDGWTSWRIVKHDNAERIEELQKRTGKAFPALFHYLLANYSFPAFEFGSLMFFANTGEDTVWELAKRLFNDPYMSPHLLAAGFLQIGNPCFYNYDPICFDCNSSSPESRIVQLDHEAILQHGDMTVLKEVAPSFIDFLQAAVR